MKRLLALILASLLLVSVFTGCSGDSDVELKGAEISMFLTTMPQSIDPSASYTAPDTVRIMGLIYEGLTTINEKGKLEKALAKSWEYEFNQKTGNLELTIDLRDSRWSDGNSVTADNFRFAWQRILKPENNNSNAALLYPVLNAKKAKEGLCSIDDIGIVSQKNKVLMITFEKDYVNEDDFSKSEIKEKVEYFMRRLASPALVPLRQDVVDDDSSSWCQKDNGSYVTNGPFKIKSWNSAELVFERSVNYRCVGDSDNNADDKIVKPYKIVINYSDGESADKHYEKFKNGETNFVNLNSASDDVVADAGKSIKTDDLYSTFCLLLDLKCEGNTLYQNEKVREALSMAIDREAIAKAVNADPATGFVPTGIDNTKAGTDFRKEGGDLISTSADIDGAKKLLKEAGITPSKQYIVFDYSNKREDDECIINEVKKAWKKLGFKIIENDASTQQYIDRKNSGELDFSYNNSKGKIIYASVLAVNVQSMTTDAYSILTQFSGEYGGNVIDVTTGSTENDVAYAGHVSGFNDAEYDKLCEEFVNAKDAKTRAAAMHKAEEYLVDKMPAIPIVFNKAYYVSDDLSKFEVDGFGRLNLTSLKLNSYSERNEKAKLKKAEEEKEQQESQNG